MQKIVCLISFPPATEMFHFAGFPPVQLFGYYPLFASDNYSSCADLPSYRLFRLRSTYSLPEHNPKSWTGRRGSPLRGFPIRASPDQRLLSTSPRLIAATPRPSSASPVEASTLRPYGLGQQVETMTFAHLATARCGRILLEICSLRSRNS